MEILGVDRGWVRNKCGPDRRVGHGYDITLPWPGILSFHFLELFVALLWLYMCALDLIDCAATHALSSSILVGFL